MNKLMRQLLLYEGITQTEGNKSNIFQFLDFL